MLFWQGRMEGLRSGLPDVYNRIEMAAEDFANLAEKLMGGNINED